MKFIFRFVKYLLCALLGVACCAVLAVFVASRFFGEDLPDHNSLKRYHPDVATRVFLQDGSKLCEYASERRYFIPINRVPKRLINAFVAVEDKHFFEHNGLDFMGIVRSVIKNIKNYGMGKRPQGASTITQQVARIFLLKDSKVSYIRKIKEAILSLRIESALSKWQILELYLNQLYIGMGAYGVAAGAKIYFDKSLDELSIAECAYLAALAKGANNYHPVLHKDRALIRRNWAIGQLLKCGYISVREANQAYKEDLQVVHPIPDETSGYFSEEVRKFLINKFPDESLNKSGLVVRATLDPRFQRCAYDALRKGLERIDRQYGWKGPITTIQIGNSQKKLVKQLQNINLPKGTDEYRRAVVLSKNKNLVNVLTDNGDIGRLDENDVRWAKNLRTEDVVFVVKNEKSHKYRLKQIPRVQGAMIVMEADSGRILAMQGGYSFEYSEFNRATQAKRQVGSAFKPFVYLAGLENGFAPNSIIDASPVEIDLGGSLGIWKPRNYRGVVLDRITFRRAIERSVNTATVRISEIVGLDKIARLAEKFGLFTNMPQYLSYALGAGETTLLQLTTAYSMFANGGKRIVPIMIDYVQNRYGQTIFKADNRTTDKHVRCNAPLPPFLYDNREQIADDRSIYQLNSLLEGVVKRGSAMEASHFGLPLAGKTGTSNDSRDVWFIGYTPDIVVGVFVGFDDHNKSLGQNASGTATALPIFVDFMEHAKSYITPKPFKVPTGIKLRKIDVESGGPITPDTKSTVIEAFKDDETINESPLFEQDKGSIASVIADLKKSQSSKNKEDKDSKTQLNDVKMVKGIY